ncbi:unnamed protein product (mitochondrion) [Plasmodiophora brassicae]|uniref:CRAL-TRIO domain-containing protein n=2 Tax=Plasmodiophora brassicae TaxID=37360 RepID=A0A3P3YEY5_PLABS|nr:unnamed protein product [Plasmodiophora brassicae]
MVDDAAKRLNELEGVSDFRRHEAFDDLVEKFSHSVILRQALVDDDFVLRFIRARKGDVLKGIIMLKAALEWRDAYGTDKAFTWTFPKIDQIKEVYPHGFHKFDKSGHPIYIERIGQLDIKALMEITNSDELCRLHVQSMEYSRSTLFPEASARAGRPVSQQVTILDMDGLSMSHASSAVYAYIKGCAEIDQSYYPEILSRMFIVNAPAVFSVVWKMIKPWLDEKTQSKISISRKSDAESILELVEADVLPEFLGGKDTTFMSSEQERNARLCAQGKRPAGSTAELRRFGFDPDNYPAQVSDEHPDKK